MAEALGVTVCSYPFFAFHVNPERRSNSVDSVISGMDWRSRRRFREWCQRRTLSGVTRDESALLAWLPSSVDTLGLGHSVALVIIL